MKLIITLFIFTVSLSSYAQDKSILAKNLANSIGLEASLNATLNQTQNALNNQTESMIKQITIKLPKLTENQKNEFIKIINNYNSKILNSIDTKKASLIYTSELSKKLSSKEIISATEYYKSAEGIKVLTTINKASTALNQYILTKMLNTKKEATPELVKNIDTLINEILKNKTK